MKLAEALNKRANYQKQLVDLKNRLLKNIIVQEGDEPAEDPTKLLREYGNISKKLIEIIFNINKTNISTFIKPEQSLTAALAEMEVLKLKHKLYTDLVQESTVITRQIRQIPTQIRLKPTINITHIQEGINKIAQEIRKLDSLIQSTNWQCDMII